MACNTQYPMCGLIPPFGITPSQSCTTPKCRTKEYCLMNFCAGNPCGYTVKKCNIDIVCPMGVPFCFYESIATSSTPASDTPPTSTLNTENNPANSVFNFNSLMIGVIVSCSLLIISVIVICILWRKRSRSRTPLRDSTSSPATSSTDEPRCFDTDNDYDVIQWENETEDFCSKEGNEYNETEASENVYHQLVIDESDTYKSIDDKEIHTEARIDNSIDQNMNIENIVVNVQTNGVDGDSSSEAVNKLHEEHGVSSMSVNTNDPDPYYELEKDPEQENSSDDGHPCTLQIDDVIANIESSDVCDGIHLSQ